MSSAHLRGPACRTEPGAKAAAVRGARGRGRRPCGRAIDPASGPPSSNSGSGSLNGSRGRLGLLVRRCLAPLDARTRNRVTDFLARACATAIDGQGGLRLSERLFDIRAGLRERLPTTGQPAGAAARPLRRPPAGHRRARLLLQRLDARRGGQGGSPDGHLAGGQRERSCCSGCPASAPGRARSSTQLLGRRAGSRGLASSASSSSEQPSLLPSRLAARDGERPTGPRSSSRSRRGQRAGRWCATRSSTTAARQRVPDERADGASTSIPAMSRLQKRLRATGQASRR